MYDAILVPTDGSPGAEAAIDRALDLARASEGEVHALSVVPTAAGVEGLDDETAVELRDDAERRGREATLRIQERATDLDLRVVRAVREGVPHEAIREYADEHGIDLVVMGTHGRTGPDLARLGSTTERVIALGDVPVLAVHLGGNGDVPGEYRAYDHVLIPTDGSDAAERAREHGLDVAASYGADVHGIYVVDETTWDFSDTPRSILGLLREGGESATESIATAARERNLPTTTAVLRGVPHEEILDYADGTDADLIVMGTRGRGGAPDRLLGSVTARVVRRSSVPVLTVR